MVSLSVTALPTQAARDRVGPGAQERSGRHQRPLVVPEVDGVAAARRAPAGRAYDADVFPVHTRSFSLRHRMAGAAEGLPRARSRSGRSRPGCRAGRRRRKPRASALPTTAWTSAEPPPHRWCSGGTPIGPSATAEVLSPREPTDCRQRGRPRPPSWVRTQHSSGSRSPLSRSSPSNRASTAGLPSDVAKTASRPAREALRPTATLGGLK